MKRHLYLWHRWLGIGLCLFMALWFVSGVVMLFVGYPKLTQAERLAPLPPLATGCCVEPAVALAASGRSEAPSSLRLVSIAGEPRYLLGYRDANLAVDARDGVLLGAQGPLQALASARSFSGAEAHYLEGVDEDLWSHSRALDADRPLHKVRVDDAAGSLLYLSSRTGEVVRDAGRMERGWNYLGAWLHWLYPLRGGVLDGLWANIVIYLSLAATAMAVLGAVVGLLRWRFSRPYRSGSRSPYPAGFARWHHLTGLGFGLLLIAWIFSGLMSMRPWHLTEGRSPLTARDFQGGELRGNAFHVGVNEALQRFRETGLEPVELQWRMLGGAAYLGALDARGDSRVLPLNGAGPALAMLPRTTLEAAAPEPVAQADWLEAYDAYYYPRGEASMYGGQPKRLPLLRLAFDDPGHSWVQIDPYSGAVLDVLDDNRRVGRWLFNLLHSWDWQPLLERPWLREVLIIAFSLGGLAISVSGVVIGWRRLRPRHKPVRSRVPARATARQS
ncbi:PepSY domain-containing protein [Pseudomonas sp. zfem005]|uniref:PepSY domain-containing protein n=1 Tax=Pseudomonas sp. zfem005 TaxID=3078200 RepID=UPI002928C108|nr:PepSY domain-containing protein [Pseudomonas sp. zfem005]MDU9412650.1 PepSY domain-containing protein [Pseudomonas sp. zfem005]